MGRSRKEGIGGRRKEEDNTSKRPPQPRFLGAKLKIVEVVCVELFDLSLGERFGRRVKTRNL